MFGLTIQIFDKCQVLIVRDTVVAAVQPGPDTKEVLLRLKSRIAETLIS